MTTSSEAFVGTVVLVKNQLGFLKDLLFRYGLKILSYRCYLISIFPSVI